VQQKDWEPLIVSALLDADVEDRGLDNTRSCGGGRLRPSVAPLSQAAGYRARGGDSES
jgi:hypothetical protein